MRSLDRASCDAFHTNAPVAEAPNVLETEFESTSFRVFKVTVVVGVIISCFVASNAARAVVLV